MTNAELIELIADYIDDETILLEGDEFADGAIGITSGGSVVYSCTKIIESLTEKHKWTYEEAVEWVDYNTIRSIPYMESSGHAPVIMYPIEDME